MVGFQRWRGDAFSCADLLPGQQLLLRSALMLRPFCLLALQCLA
jgi:hypothetical protein